VLPVREVKRAAKPPKWNLDHQPLRLLRAARLDQGAAAALSEKEIQRQSDE
jgi:hypothetical protein